MKLGPFSFGMLCLAEQCSVSCSQMGVCLWVIMSDVTSLLLAGLVVVRQSFLSEMDWIDLPKFHQHDSHQRAESLLCASRKIYIIISIVWILILPYLLFHIPGHVFVFVFGCLQVPQTCGVIFGNFFSPGSISFHVWKDRAPKAFWSNLEDLFCQCAPGVFWYMGPKKRPASAQLRRPAAAPKSKQSKHPVSPSEFGESGDEGNQQFPSWQT